MMKMKNKLNNLNWSGFLFIMILSLLGTISNHNITNTIDAILIGLCIGFPIGLIFLIVGREK